MRRALASPRRAFWSFSKSRVLHAPTPPPIATHNEAFTLPNGIKRVDPYRWMESKERKGDLMKYIEEEQRYTRDRLKQLRPLAKTVQKALHACLTVSRKADPVPDRLGPFEYFTQTSPTGSQYFRRQECILSADDLPIGTVIKKAAISVDHNCIAYVVELNGEEYGSLYVKDLRSRPHSVLESGSVTRVFNFEWANDNRTLLYTRCDEQLRPHQVYAHIVGSDQTDDVLVFQAEDDVFLDISKTKDKAFFTINASTLSSSEVHVIPASTPTASPRCFQPRQADLEYYVDHHENRFYILTNADGAEDFKLVTCGDALTTREHWQDLIVMPTGMKIEDIDLFKDYAAVYVTEEGSSKLMVFSFKDQELYTAVQPATACTMTPGSNQSYDTDTVRFSFSHPYAFDSVFDYNMSSRSLAQRSSQPLSQRAFDRAKFDITRTFAPSRDGVRIPVTLLHRKGLHLDGRAYGAYGMSMAHHLRLDTIPLLNQNWIVCIAHVRGGSELGRRWYREGQLLQKKNTFSDFLDVADFLLEEGFTQPRLLTATGVSAGGLCVAAAALMRPELFRALVLNVPFVDVVSSMLDPELPLTRIEYLEWGDPAIDAQAYRSISEYSPYDLLMARYHLANRAGERHPSHRLPSLYITAGLQDQRVPFWQVAKFVAMYRQVVVAQQQSQPSDVIFRCEEDMAHFADPTGQHGELAASADQTAFLLDAVCRAA
ncbi:hypothetical protein RI367_004287 [Sorochytrium milnesiophthora]